MEFELFDPPSDGISALAFSPSPASRRKFLLACSWDSSAYLYDASGNVPMGRWSVGAALLDGCFWARDGGRSVAHAVGLSRQVHRYELANGIETYYLSLLFLLITQCSLLTAHYFCCLSGDIVTSIDFPVNGSTSDCFTASSALPCLELL